MTKEQQLAHEVGRAVAEAVAPLLGVLDARMASIEDRVRQVVPRRHLSPRTKQRHLEAIQRLGSRCPCCAARNVVDDAGGPLEAEFDHFYSRERHAFEDTWLVCRPCHRGLTNAGDRARAADAFRLYQERAAKLPGTAAMDLFADEQHAAG